MMFDTQELCGRQTDRGFNMSTASGKPIWPADLRVEDIRIDDIAWHLARLCRFNGALKEGAWIDYEVAPEGAHITGIDTDFRRVFVSFEVYSVAQHSVHICDRITEMAPNNRQLQLAALFHDSPEFIFGDMVKPIKGLHPGRKKLEAGAADVICDWLQLPRGIFDDPRIKEQDYRAVLTEHRDVQACDGSVDWGLSDAKAEPWPERIVPILPSAAHALFVRRFNDITRFG